MVLLRLRGHLDLFIAGVVGILMVKHDERLWFPSSGTVTPMGQRWCP